MTFLKTGIRVKEIVYINIFIYTISLKIFSPESEIENVISSLRHFVINTHLAIPSSATLPMELTWKVGRGG